MPNFLLGLEYNQETTLLAAAISFVLATLLVWIMMGLASRSRLRQLRSTLEKEIASSEQQRMQLGSELNDSQQKLQQTELKVTEQIAQIAQLEKDKQAQAERALTLESSLNQKDQKLADLTQQLQDSETIRLSLQQAQQSWQNNLNEKEAAIAKLTNSVNEQAEQVKQLEQNLQEQQTLAHHYDAMINTEIEKQLNHSSVVQHKETAIPEDSTLRRHYLGLLRADIEKTQAPRPIDATLRPHYDAMIDAEIEKHLACHANVAQQSKLDSVTLPVPEQQQTRIKLQKSYQALEKKIADSESAIKELQAALETAQHQIKLATENSSNHEATIAELNTTLAAQANHLSRLEQLLDSKHKDVNKTADHVETVEQQQTWTRLQENYQALEQKLANSEAVINELQTRLAAQTPADSVAIESTLAKKLSNQEATIAKLNATLAEQANYFSRLEYDLEVKKAIIKDHNYPLQGVPAAIIAKQEEDQARIAELEQLVKPGLKQKAIKNTPEKPQSKPADLLNPAKQQVEGIADKAKHFPDLLKGLYKKALTPNTAEIPQPEPVHTLVPEAAKSATNAQPEESNRKSNFFAKKFKSLSETIAKLP